jgi:hypothetical protein
MTIIEVANTPRVSDWKQDAARALGKHGVNAVTGSEWSRTEYGVEGVLHVQTDKGPRTVVLRVARPIMT